MKLFSFSGSLNNSEISPQDEKRLEKFYHTHGTNLLSAVGVELNLYYNITENMSCANTTSL